MRTDSLHSSIRKRIFEIGTAVGVEKAMGVAQKLNGLSEDGAELMRRLRDLALRLSRAADRFDNPIADLMTDSFVNSLGEIQGEGSRIDVACAVFFRKQVEAQAAYNALMESAAQENKDAEVTA